MRRFFGLALACLLVLAIPAFGGGGEDDAVQEGTPPPEESVSAPSSLQDDADNPEKLPSATPVVEPTAKVAPPATATEAPLPLPYGVANDEINILVVISQQKLYLRRGAAVLEVYPVSTGKSDTPTPIGQWRISQKLPYTKPVPQYGTRWMRIDQFDPSTGRYEWTDYGIHGTDEPERIGAPVSAGCVRMFNKDVEALFQVVSLGTPVLTAP